MYRVEIMMCYGDNRPAKNILYPKVMSYSVGDDGFFNLVYAANRKTYHRGVSMRNIITYTVSECNDETHENSEELCNDGADN